MRTQFLDVSDFAYEINQSIDNYIPDNMTRCKADDMGLDPRSGYELYFDSSAIAVNNRYRSQLDYYGGFEYIDNEFVTHLGDWTIYSSEADRVAECLARILVEEAV